MKADPTAPRDATRAVRWGAHLLYLAAIGVLYVNSLPTAPFAVWRLALEIALVPLVVGAVLLRVRFPYALPLLGLVAMVTGTFAVFIVGMMSLAVRRAGAGVWIVASAGSALAVTMVVTRDLAAGEEPGVLVAGIVLSLLIVAVAPTLIGGYVRTHRRLAASIAERAIRAEFERELAAQRAVHTERERIAQEMHDSLGHVLALITMQAGALEVKSRDPETVTAAEQIRESARSGLRELRTVVRAFGADARRDPMPELSAVPRLVAASQAAGADVRLSDEIAPGPATVPSSVGRLAYQAVQEGLTNAHRHAPGAPVAILLSGVPEAGIEVTVSNPLAPGGERGSGTGLSRLRSRVEVLGGELEARAAQGRFELRVLLPWEVVT